MSMLSHHQHVFLFACARKGLNFTQVMELARFHDSEVTQLPREQRDEAVWKKFGESLSLLLKRLRFNYTASSREVLSELTHADYDRILEQIVTWEMMELVEPRVGF